MEPVARVASEDPDAPARPRWGSSVRGSIRQWALTSVASLSVSNSEQGEWFCERCTYRNADQNNQTCALCGWNRVTGTVESRNSVAVSSAPAPVTPDYSQPADSEASSSSTVQTSHIGQSGVSFDVSQSDIGSVDTGAAESHSLVHSQLPSPAISTGLSVNTGDPSNGLVATNSTASTQCSSNWWDESETAIVESQGGKRCSNRAALVWLLLLLLLISGVTILAVLVKERNANGNQEASTVGSATGDATTDPIFTPSPTNEPSGTSAPTPGTSPDPPQATAQPTYAPTAQTFPPSTMPTVSPTEVPSRVPSVSPTEVPSRVPSVSPTQAPTTIPSLPDSVSLARLGETISGVGVGNSFGDSIALAEDGKTVAIGSPQILYNFQERPGVVQVFKLFEGGWRKLGDDLIGEARRDLFGRALSLSKDGSILAIGGPGNDAAGQDAGHVIVYRYNESDDEWKQLGPDVDGADMGKSFGLSVALAGNGNVLAVGAKRYAEVYEFDDQQQRWASLGDSIMNTDGNGDRWKVVLSDDGLTLAVGAPGPSPGYVRVYDNKGVGRWVQRGRIDDDITFDYSDACISVSLSGSGDVVAVRATTAVEDLTKVFVYNSQTTVWELLGGPIYWRWPFDFWAWIGFKIDCTEYSQFLTLSRDGRVVVINGDLGPLMFWFNEASNTWDELVNGNGGRIFGDTVSLSRNGRVVAVGDESNRRVNVFELR